jgi:hypothetical protein
MLLLRFVMRRLIFRMLTSCGFLLSWLHILQLLILLLLCCWPLLQLFLLLLMMRVLVFTMITVVEMDMWKHFATRRRKLRRLRLAILHRVPVLLVLEDMRAVLLV